MPASGAAQLRALSGQAKILGSTALINATRAELRAEAKSLIAAMQQAARTNLPRSGGLNEWVADQKWTVSSRTGARTAGVSVGNKRRGAGQTNSGYVRHPVYGRWLPDQPSQRIPGAAGWATDTAEKRVPALAVRMTATLNVAVARGLKVTSL